MVERLHRQLKAAIKCHTNKKWTKMLPIILLGIRAACREDLQTTAAEIVYGETLRLPGQFLVQQSMENSDDDANFVKELRRYFDKLRPIDGTRHGERYPFVFKDLKKAEHVFLRHDGPKAMLLSYDGSFTVVLRNDKNFTIRIYDKNITISIDGIKPVYLFSDLLTDICETINNQDQQNQTNLIRREADNEDNERVTNQRKFNTKIHQFQKKMES